MQQEMVSTIYLDPALLPLEHTAIKQSHDGAGLGCE